MPEPLPRPNPYDLTSHLVLHSAYNKCLDLETRYEQVKKSFLLQVLVCARFLGYMLLRAPTDGGREDFAWEIWRCSGDETMQELAQLYSDHLLRIFPRNKGRTPSPRSHPSAQTTPSKHDKAKKKLCTYGFLIPFSEALYRDGYRCILSGKLDSSSVSANLVAPKPGEKETVTEASHIFERSTNEGQSAYAASALAILFRLGQITSIEELHGKNLHRLENVLTLDAVLHRHFDSLSIWLEKTNADPNRHCYKLVAIRPSMIDDRLVDHIELTTPDPVEYPLPDHRYLALHAACAQIAHLSGVGEYIDRVLREIETIGVLASNGGSDVLYHALVRHSDIEAY
ncbi:hypothetical protein B0H34DRAFT_812323 [Crassisporium funariophilum]|nr:hypothetical protein B0H34DRAFT_812323 [Crassisporium funariophilum]